MRSEAHYTREIQHELWVDAAAKRVFAFLTSSKRMRDWLAPQVAADPRPNGIFRLMDFDGHWIEGRYLEIIPNRLVTFTWGGIEGLKIGQSTVKFRLHPQANGTMLRLHHEGVHGPAFETHDRRWLCSGLPKLKAVVERKQVLGTYLSDVAEGREQYSYVKPANSS